MDIDQILERLEPWMAIVEKETCIGCPAFKWVIPGQDKCRLGFGIDQDRPMIPCLRPQTVGAAFVIAREMGRPEPMVGKLDKWQYEEYLAEKETTEC